MNLVQLVPEYIHLIENFASAEECSALIARGERLGFEPAALAGGQMRPDVRDNARVIFDDPALAASLWSRARAFIPESVGSMKAVGLNPRFRYYRYDPGERFRWHTDGSVRLPTGEQSLFTLIVYLNEGFDGGETRFRHNDVRPQTGLALLFRHNIEHEGSAVTTGRKYVLRTDVMFAPT